MYQRAKYENCPMKNQYLSSMYLTFYYTISVCVELVIISSRKGGHINVLNNNTVIFKILLWDIKLLINK